MGGAAGTLIRYLVTAWAAQRLPEPWPYGTLIVNLAGCFAMAVVMHAGTVLAWPPGARVAVTAGFLGGLTTYSSFNQEALQLVETSPAAAAGYVALTVGGGLAAGLLGLACARQLVGR